MPGSTIAMYWSAVMTLVAKIDPTSEATSAPQASNGRPSAVPTTGAMITSGSPVSTQCEATLASSSQPRGCPESTHCSMVPSSTSDRNKDSSASSDASSAATQTTPPEITRSCARSGVVASGNSVVTTT